MKLTKNVALSALAATVIAGASLTGGVANAAPEISDQVTLYEDVDFKGKNISLSEGYYDYRNWGDLGNDTLSSIKIPGNYKVTLYSDIDRGGSSKELTEDVANFYSLNLNDKISAIQIDKIKISETSGLYLTNPDIELQLISTEKGGKVKGEPGRIIRFVDAHNPNVFTTKVFGEDEIELPEGNYKLYDVTHLIAGFFVTDSMYLGSAKVTRTPSSPTVISVTLTIP